MPRTILVHLNVTLPDGREDVGPDEIADAILAAIEVASDDDYNFGGKMLGRLFGRLTEGELASGNGSPIVCTLAEEV